MQLRVVAPDDWTVWRDTRLRALADAADSFRASLEEWQSADERRWRQRLSDVPFNVVAEDGGRLVGQASGTDLDSQTRIELISMWVEPETRGSGVADALVAAVADYGRGLEAVAIRLSVRRHNARAIRFYTRLGFEAADEPGDEPAEMAEMAMVLPLRT